MWTMIPNGVTLGGDSCIDAESDVFDLCILGAQVTFTVDGGDSLGTKKKLVLESVKMRQSRERLKHRFLDKNVFEQHKAGWAD